MTATNAILNDPNLNNSNGKLHSWTLNRPTLFTIPNQ